MEKLVNLPGRLAEPFRNWSTYDLFKKVLYTFLFVNTISLLPIATEIWDFHGIADFRGWSGELPWYKQFSFAVTNMLSHPATNTRPWIIWIFIAGQLCALILGFLEILPRLASVMVYLFTVNLFLKGSLLFTGGELLLSILLFYMIFIQFTSVERLEEGRVLRFRLTQSILNNTFFLALKIQVCFVYFFSSLYKLLDPVWLEGKAMQYISGIEAYDNGLHSFLFEDSTFLSALATYVALGYQLAFPLVIWIRRLKKSLLFIGVFIHIAIAIGMGIFSFGIIMILVYILFLDEEDVIKIRRRLKMNNIMVHKA